jgi:hypothetical protein
LQQLIDALTLLYDCECTVVMLAFLFEAESFEVDRPVPWYMLHEVPEDASRDLILPCPRFQERALKSK